MRARMPVVTGLVPVRCGESHGGVPEDGEPVNRPSEARDVGGVSGTSFATGCSWT
jgi:hypothetical protein